MLVTPLTAIQNDVWPILKGDLQGLTDGFDVYREKTD